MSIAIKVKWGKEVYDLTVNPDDVCAVFKAQVESLTMVPVDRQKWMGATLVDDKPLSQCGVTNGKTLMVVGSADAALVEAKAKVKFSEDGDSRLQVVKGGVRGIQNVGNTCYFNSSLQIMRKVPELVEVAGTSSGMASAIVRTIRDLNTGISQPLVPFTVLGNLHAAYPQFAETDGQGRLQQQDAQEAFSSMMSSISTACQSSPDNANAFQRLFTIRFSENIKCEESDAEPERSGVLESTTLTCNIGAETFTIENGFQMQGSVEMQSDVLGRSAIWKKQLKVTFLPEYLVVHLVRFSWRRDTSQKAKILKPVGFPMVLDMYSYCSDELKKQLDPERERLKDLRDEIVMKKKANRGKPQSDEELLPPAGPRPPLGELGNRSGYYELCGVISHKGRTGDGGHYVAWVKEDNGDWVIADDENSAVVSDEEISRLKGVGEAHIAYLLLYRTRNPKSNHVAMPI